MTPVKDTSAQAVSALMALATSPSSKPKAGPGPGSDRPSTGGSLNSADTTNTNTNKTTRGPLTNNMNMDEGEGMDATHAADMDTCMNSTADGNMNTNMNIDAAITTSTSEGEPAMAKKSSGLSTGSTSTPATPRSSRTEPTAASSMNTTATNHNNPPEDDFAKQASNITRFPNKLMAILDSNQYNDVICWSPDGTSFVFHDCDDFERVVLPDIFKVAKFDSFLRKLYRWGFSKCQAYSRVGCPAYKHEKFIRDQPELLTEMECRSKPKTQYSAAVPLTLNSFQAQTVQANQNLTSPQLGQRISSDTIGTDQSSSVTFDGIPNAVWKQPQQTTSSQGMSPLSSGIASGGVMEDQQHMQTSMPKLPSINQTFPTLQESSNADNTNGLNLNTMNANAVASDILKNKLALAASIEEQNRLLAAARASIMNNSTQTQAAQAQAQAQAQLGNLSNNLASLSGPYRSNSTNSLASTSSISSKKRRGSNLDSFTRPTSSHRSLSNFSSSRSKISGSLNSGGNNRFRLEKNSTFQIGAGGGHKQANAMDNARKMLNQLNIQQAAPAASNNVGGGTGGDLNLGAQQQQQAGLLLEQRKQALAALLQQKLSSGDRNNLLQQQAELLLGQQQQQQQQQQQTLAALNAIRAQGGLNAQQQTQAQGQGNLLQAAKALLEQQNAATLLNAAARLRQQGGEQTLSAVLEQENMNAMSAMGQQQGGDNNLTSAGAAASVLTPQQPQAGLSLERQKMLAALHSAGTGGDQSRATNSSSSGGIPNEAPQAGALGILQLLEEHERLEQQMKNQLLLQNQVNRLRLENEMKRQLLRNEVSRRQQEAQAIGQQSNDVSQAQAQARLLQNEIARRAQLQNLINNMDTSNEGNGTQSYGNQDHFPSS